MRKTLLILTVVLTGSLLTNSAKAQDSKILAGAGFSYLTEIESIGLSINGTYLFNDNWEGAVTYTHVFESDMVSWNLYDFNAHYVFSTGEKTKAYGIAGINHTSMKMSADLGEFGDFSASAGETGFNLGAGLRYSATDKISLTGEAKYVIGDLDYLSIGLGVLYSF